MASSVPPNQTINQRSAVSMEQSNFHISSGVRQAAPYEQPPSPPVIIIPTPDIRNASEPLTVVPNYTNIDPAALSVNDLEIITQNRREQTAHDSALSWAYESRRTAQPILDFLYLGPSSVARDRQWLRDNGITMLLAARDAQMAEFRLMAVDKVAQELGIQAEHVDVSGYQELIRAFPSTVQKINDHMLHIYHQQGLGWSNAGAKEGSTAIDPANIRRGRVLVFCETGNTRSAAVVVAYLMAVLGMDMVSACQFVHFKRFSISLDEDLKKILQTYWEILVAQRNVHSQNLDAAASNQAKKQKRCIDDTMDEDEGMGGTIDVPSVDRDRFVGRQAFAPFVDVNQPKRS
ncbi:protein-tyrosine phosphatase-like protein [Xylariaceae sp. FL0662B]|nr:protein-tyrosine phosphatase-like protein [Xylariaceae sp. FL0662B]